MSITSSASGFNVVPNWYTKSMVCTCSQQHGAHHWLHTLHNHTLHNQAQTGYMHTQLPWGWDVFPSTHWATTTLNSLWQPVHTHNLYVGPVQWCVWSNLHLQGLCCTASMVIKEREKVNCSLFRHVQPNLKRFLMYKPTPSVSIKPGLKAGVRRI